MGVYGSPGVLEWNTQPPDFGDSKDRGRTWGVGITHNLQLEFSPERGLLWR